MSIGKWLQTFRRTVFPPHSGTSSPGSLSLLGPLDPEDTASMLVRNVGKNLPVHTA